MKITNGLIVGAALAATVAAKAAAAGEPPPVREGWYVAPMATYLSPDADRCGASSELGFSAALGHRGETASVELWAQSVEVPYASCTYTYPAPTPTDPDATAQYTEPAGTLELNGGGIALLVGPFGPQWYARVYGLIGIGVMQAENRIEDDDDDSTIVGDIGAGYLQPLRLWQRDFYVRLEARYRYDAHQPPHAERDYDPDVPKGFNDVVVNLGLQVPLSAPPADPAAAAEPVNVVPVTDSDHDGVPDEVDTCPDTMPGLTVDALGCTPAAEPSSESPTGDAS
jgi:hypothetical protein